MIQNLSKRYMILEEGDNDDTDIVPQILSILQFCPPPISTGVDSSVILSALVFVRIDYE
jgi:hypothetical protein